MQARVVLGAMHRFDNSIKLPLHTMLARLAAIMPGDVSVLRTTSAPLPAVSATSAAKVVERLDATFCRPNVRSRLRLALLPAVPMIAPRGCPMATIRCNAARPTPPATGQH